MAANVVTKPGYVGETKNLLRDGHGVYVYENAFFRYEGTWKNGKKHGHGKLLMRDGTFYEGQFVNGEITGHGYKFFASTKSRYTGQFLNGELEGYGVMNQADGMQYEGEWHKNKKQGMGVMKLPDGTYKGCFQGHLRHGQGTLMYKNVYKKLRNGDFYKGYWVLDKRQGHGRLVCSDGTIYEGQWFNDLFHGDGFMEHASGILYSGNWVNGLPERMAAKIVITNEQLEIDLKQGETFSITVEVRDGANELVEDQGRELQITAGFKYYPPVGTSEPALFDMIEDMEDKPITTPFGYDIVGYPLTDQAVEEEKEEGEPDESKTSGSEIDEGKEKEKGEHEERLDSVKDDPEGEGQKNDHAEEKAEEPKEEVKEEPKNETVEAKKEEGTKEEEQKEGEKDGETKSGTGSRVVTPAEGQDFPVDNDTAPDEPESKVDLFYEGGDSKSNVKGPVVSRPLPPPVSNKRTGNGKCCWENVYLAPPPPMYRPFLAMEEAEKARLKQKSSKQNLDKTDSKHKEKQQKVLLSDEMYARTGEYVVMVSDVTNPPFLSHTLEPAFLLVKLRKLKVAPIKKPSKPKWDTKGFIAMAMARHSIED